MARPPSIEHHADFAVAIAQSLWVETRVPRLDGVGNIAGQAIALGWWVDPGQTDPASAAGTLYLIVDEEQDGPPAWIAEGNIVRCRLLND